MNLSKFTIAALILALSCPYSGQAMGGATKAPPSKAPTLQQSYVWYDGQQKRQIWLDPGLVAEFYAGNRKPAKSAVKSVYADAVPVPTRHGAILLWRLGGGVSPETAVRTLAATNKTGKYSPVLHDGPTTAGRMRALPGNVILYLNPAWDTMTVNVWLNKRQIHIVKKLEIGPNIYVIKTGPGLEALDTANELYTSGEVVAAFPEWWEEVTTR